MSGYASSVSPAKQMAQSVLGSARILGPTSQARPARSRLSVAITSSFVLPAVRIHANERVTLSLYNYWMIDLILFGSRPASEDEHETRAGARVSRPPLRVQ